MRNYLRGAHYFGRGKGLAVYYWRHPASAGAAPPSVPTRKRAINVDDPYRVFLDFNRAASGTWWMEIVRAAIGVVLAIALLKAGQSVSFSGLDLASVGWFDVLKVVVGGAVVTWLSTIDKLRLWASGKFLLPRRVMRRVERWLLSPWN